MQKYARNMQEICIICTHEIYMQNMQKFALPTLLMAGMPLDLSCFKFHGRLRCVGGCVCVHVRVFVCATVWDSEWV